MSSNRLIYDQCAYAAEIKESTSPLDYNLYKGKYETCTQCKAGDYPNVIELGPRADVESELYGINRRESLCPSMKYDPTKEFKTPLFTPPRVCASIYHITPNNLEKPTGPMINESKLGVNFCSKEQ
jgi:hypothetical protein